MDARDITAVLELRIVAIVDLARKSRRFIFPGTSSIAESPWSMAMGIVPR